MRAKWGKLSLYSLLFLLCWPWLVKFDLIHASNMALLFYIAVIYLNYLSFVLGLAQGHRYWQQGIAPAHAVWLFFCSNILLIIAFAIAWQKFDLFGPVGQCLHEPDIVDSLYFSTTTFATIGFGDFVPCNKMGKILLIAEGLLGSTHFGIFITLIFSRVISPRPSQNDTSSHTQD